MKLFLSTAPSGIALPKRQNSGLHYIFNFAASLCVFSAFSQNDSIVQPQSLQPVIVSSFYVNDSLMRAPAAIGILSESDLQRNNLADISPVLNTVAGVFMQSGSINTNRISIRGIGARTPFGTNKIRAFYGNIPLTSGDSETTIEDIDIENIEQVEIIKGPLSSVYGAGLGGAILLSPKVSEAVGHNARVSTTYGSFGLMKTSTAYSYNSGRGSLNLNYHYQDLDGWRQNSQYRREGATLAGELFRTEKGKLTYFANYTFVKAYIPSSIDRETFLENPQAAAFTWNAAKGFEQYDSYFGGLSYEWRLSKKITNATSIFVNYKESNEPRPFDILRQDTEGFGARTQFTGDFKKFRVLTGFEYFNDGFDAATFENLYQQNNGNGSLQGNQLSGTAQQRSFINVFAQARVPISKKLELQAGVNLNQTRFSLDEDFPTRQAEQRYEYGLIASPQVAILYRISATKTLFAALSRGFSLPAIEETLNANGTINRDIQPEKGYNFEVGGKFYLFDRSLYAEVSAYRMLINDLLVAQRIGEDQYVGVNAGETLHQGIEITVNYNKRFGTLLTVAPSLAVSVGDYTFEKFVSNDVDYSGNELTGVPDTKLNAGISLRSDSGLYLSADFQYVDGFPINDANTVYSVSYRIWNLKAGYRAKFTKNLQAHFAAGVNNLGDEKYAAMLLVNATGFGTSAPRYYYPGLPVNYYANVSFTYTF